MIVAEFVPSVNQGTIRGWCPTPVAATVHLVAPHKSRPELAGRRLRPLCGRGGTVLRELPERPDVGICSDCLEIEPMRGER